MGGGATGWARQRFDAVPARLLDNAEQVERGTDREDSAPVPSTELTERGDARPCRHTGLIEDQGRCRDAMSNHEICHQARLRDAAARAAGANDHRRKPLFVQLDAAHRAQSQRRARPGSPDGGAEHDDGVGRFEALGPSGSPDPHERHHTDAGERQSQKREVTAESPHVSASPRGRRRSTRSPVRPCCRRDARSRRRGRGSTG